MNNLLNKQDFNTTELSDDEMTSLSGGWFWEALLIVGYIALKIYQALSSDQE